MLRTRPDPRFGWIGLLVLLATGLQLPDAQARHPALAGNEPSAAVDMLDPEALQSRALNYLQAEVAAWPAEDIRYEVAVDGVDPRVRLADCGEALEIDAGPGGIRPGRVSLKAACDGPTPWTIYLSGSVRGLKEVLVATRPLGRNQVIASADVMLAEQDVARLARGYFTDPVEVVGKVVKRAIPGNRVISARAVAMPRLIRRGEPVQIIAENASVRVQMEGVALSDGALGDRIQVRNTRSGRVVSATVQEAGAVYIQL